MSARDLLDQLDKDPEDVSVTSTDGGFIIDGDFVPDEFDDFL